MRSDILIAIGVIVILQLSSMGRRVSLVNRQIEGLQKKLDDLHSGLLAELGSGFESISREFQWHKNYTFANALRGWIDKTDESIRGEFQSLRDEFDRQHKPHTFASNLREWIDKAAESIRGEFQWHKDLTFAHSLRGWIETANQDLASEIQSGTQEVVDALSAIERNSSED